MAKIFDTTEYAKWKGFRQSEDSRYVGLCLPHILMRLPYGRDTAGGWLQLRRRRGRNGPQQISVGQRRLCAGRAHDQRVRVLYGWCAAIRGVEGGGLVEGLPAHTFRTDDGDVALKCPTEIADHRPPREGTGGSGFDPAGALQGDGQRGFLQRAVRQQGQAVR